MVVAAFCAGALFGCGVHPGSVPTSATRGDCTASIRFHDVVYIANMHVDQEAPKGRTIGPGAVVDCDHRTVVDRVFVYAVTGADNRQAIGVRGRWHGIYVAEHLPQTRWPSIIRRK
jgi:hypothetical protein